jgi:hypothetical protein
LNHMWGIVKRRVWKLRPVVSTQDKLWPQIEQVWEGASQAMIDRQIDRMAAQRLAVIKAKGGHTPF